MKQECFNSPYGTQYFADYAEKIPGETSNTLSKLAKDLQIHLVGGSMPESCDGKIYNTTPVFGPDGEMLGKFSKVKLVSFMIRVLRVLVGFYIIQSFTINKRRGTL